MATGKKARSTSLVSPSGMGGIIGGGGYDFQARYIACHVPKWLLDTAFQAIMHEGTGDVDVLVREGTNEERDHIQVKDHVVSGKGEIKEVIETFQSIDKDFSGGYRCFTLVCPVYGGKVKTLVVAIDRYRKAGEFFASKPSLLSSTMRDVKAKIAALGLTSHESFILEKVHFQKAAVDFHDDDVTSAQFATGLLQHPEHSEKILKVVQPVYSSVFKEVVKRKGEVLDRSALSALIDHAFASGGDWFEDIVDIDIHNWVVGKYDREPHHTFDWSEHFDRSTRKVPEETFWNSVAVPALSGLSKQLARSATRRVRMRGKSVLTTGFLLGAAFPQVGGWTLDIDQPPSPRPWRSNALVRRKYQLKVSSEVAHDHTGDSIAFVLNVKGDAKDEVEKFIASTSLPVKAIVYVTPEGGAGAMSIADDREAVSLAVAFRDLLGSTLGKYSVRKTHLFFFGPFALAAFIGQLLTSVGQVQLYEFTEPGYKPSALLRT